MEELIAQLGGDDALPEAIGALVAIALLVGLRLTLGSKKSLLRFPLIALCLHFAAVTLRRAVPAVGGAHRVLSSLSLLFLLLSIGRASVLLIVDVALERRFLRPLPKITRDIVQGLVYAGIAIAALRAAGVEPGSLLTTSALLTAVIGLSLQETLGNLFAGLAIQAQRPFDVGDWIQFDSEQKHIGRVIEINWRATKVVTLDEVEIIVPNGTLAKVPISNYTKPSNVSRRSIYVHTRYDVPPATVQALILAAIADSFGVVRDPPPSVVTNQFADNGIEYWVRFFTDKFDKRDGVDGGVRDRIWYAFHRAGIAIPYPAHSIEVKQIDDASSERVEQRRFDRLDSALRCVDFFQVLDTEDIRSLAGITHHRLFAPGEIIVRQGDDTKELYVIERGEVAVQIARPGGGTQFEVARLGQGKFFGEMALVTGDVRHATVLACGHCELLEVPQAALQHLFAKAPDLAERMSEVLGKRQAELDARSASLPAPSEGEVIARTSQLLMRIKRVFSL